MAEGWAATGSSSAGIALLYRITNHADPCVGFAWDQVGPGERRSKPKRDAGRKPVNWVRVQDEAAPMNSDFLRRLSSGYRKFLHLKRREWKTAQQGQRTDSDWL